MGSIIHLVVDIKCNILHFGAFLAAASPGEDCQIELRKGRHLLTFISEENPEDQYAIEYEVADNDYEDYIVVELAPYRERRLSLELKRKREAEDAECLRLAEIKRNEELERQRQIEEAEKLFKVLASRLEEESKRQKVLKEREKRKKLFEQTKDKVPMAGKKVNNNVNYKHLSSCFTKKYFKFQDFIPKDINGPTDVFPVEAREKDDPSKEYMAFIDESGKEIFKFEGYDFWPSFRTSRPWLIASYDPYGNYLMVFISHERSGGGYFYDFKLVDKFGNFYFDDTILYDGSINNEAQEVFKEFMKELKYVPYIAFRDGVYHRSVGNNYFYITVTGIIESGYECIKEIPFNQSESFVTLDDKKYSTYNSQKSEKYWILIGKKRGRYYLIDVDGSHEVRIDERLSGHLD